MPKRLHPKRGKRGWRYWTPAQVAGIEEWMEKNDLRPGKSLANPAADPEQHIRNLRRPKHMNKHIIKLVRAGAKNGLTAKEICADLYPHTKYEKPENMERACRRYFSDQGWYFPPAVRPKRDPPVNPKIKKSKKPKKPVMIHRAAFLIPCPQCTKPVYSDRVDAHMKSKACLAKTAK